MNKQQTFRLSFARRVFISFFVLLLLLQTTTTWVAYNASRDNVETQLREKLLASKKLFVTEFENRRRYLLGAVSTIAKDWGFRQAVGQLDKNTVNSVLNNHRRRIASDIGFLVTTDGQMLGSTMALPAHVTMKLFDTITASADSHNEFIVRIDRKLYQFIVLPVKAPVTLGWVGMGFAIDDALAQSFAKTTNLSISFVVTDSTKTSIAASTLPALQRQSRTELSIIEQEQLVSPFFAQGSTDILQLGIKLDTHTDILLHVLMEKSIEELLDNFNHWWIDVLVLFIVTLTAAAFIAAFIARGVTKPLQSLLTMMRQVTSGHYDGDLTISRGDEIGALALEFQTMREAVAERELEIRRRAEHDPLTDLYNREYFLNRLQQTIDENAGSPHRLAVVLFNLSRFKDVNNALGHDIGDKLLQQLSRRLINCFPLHQLSRHGADQFVIFADIDQYNEVQNLCKKIQGCFAIPFVQGGINITLSCIQGIAIYPDHSNKALSLLRFADVALLTAKEKHLDVCVYDNKLDQHSVQRLTLISDLPKAIKNDEFTLHYQPTLALSPDGLHHVSKVECLIRWIHPLYGFIPPDEFIHLAEQTGAITDITAWVLKEATRQCRQWMDKGFSIGIAVNISAADLFCRGLQDKVRTLLEQHRIPVDQLTIEVTESEVMRDPQQACAELNALRELGVRLSVDDYGTGYSSLAHLKKLPVHDLKIDKSFVMDVIKDKDDAIIVCSTIDLGHSMGLDIVAEGVEDQATLDFLCSKGCNYAQGYYISKPLPASEFQQWLALTHYNVVQQSA